MFFLHFQHGLRHTYHAVIISGLTIIITKNYPETFQFNLHLLPVSFHVFIQGKKK